MSKIQLYGLIASPPTRAIMMVCDIIGVSFELITLEPGNKTPEFKKLNPSQQLPVLVDDGFTLSESRTIMKYLVEKYAKDDTLYPKDLKTRAVINARLDFDNGSLWPKIMPTFGPLFRGGQVSEEALQNLKDTVSVVEEFLTRDQWIAGSKMTIADISYSTIIYYIKELQFDVTPYPKIVDWLKECYKVPEIEQRNEQGLAAFRERMEKYGIKLNKA